MPEVVINREQVAPKAPEVEVLPVPAAPMKAAMNKRQNLQVAVEADHSARSLRAKIA